MQERARDHPPVRRIEAETSSVARVTNGSVVRRRGKINQGLDARVNRSTGQGQQINRIQRAIVGTNVSEVPRA